MRYLQSLSFFSVYQRVNVAWKRDLQRQWNVINNSSSSTRVARWIITRPIGRRYLVSTKHCASGKKDLVFARTIGQGQLLQMNMTGCVSRLLRIANQVTKSFERKMLSTLPPLTLAPQRPQLIQQTVRNPWTIQITTQDSKILLNSLTKERRNGDMFISIPLATTRLHIFSAASEVSGLFLHAKISFSWSNFSSLPFARVVWTSSKLTLNQIYEIWVKKCILWINCVTDFNREIRWRRSTEIDLLDSRQL